MFYADHVSQWYSSDGYIIILHDMTNNHRERNVDMTSNHKAVSMAAGTQAMVTLTGTIYTQPHMDTGRTTPTCSPNRIITLQLLCLQGAINQLHCGNKSIPGQMISWQSQLLVNDGEQPAVDRPKNCSEYWLDPEKQK